MDALSSSSPIDDKSRLGLATDAANIKPIEQLSQSHIFQDFESAFSETTGLPLALRSLEESPPAHRNKKFENPFCALMAGHNPTCVGCLKVQEQLAEDTGHTARTVTCFAGLTDSAVPVRLGGSLIGFLQTGQIFIRRPDRGQLLRTLRQLLEWGMEADCRQLEKAYFQTRVLSPEEYDSRLRLLAIFGQYLALVNSRLLIQQTDAEPTVITRARQLVNDHQTDDLFFG